MKLLTYFDYFNETLDNQLELLEKSNIKDFTLRKINGLSFLEWNYMLLSYLTRRLENIYIILIDPVIDPNKYDNYIYFKHLRKVKIFMKKLKINNIILRLPNFNIYDKFIKIKIRKHVSKISKIFRNYHIYIKPFNKMDDIIINYISNEINLRDNISILFEPSFYYLNNKSIFSQFEIQKRKIGMISINDLQENNMPALMGYGLLDLISFLKIVYKNNYNKNILYDSNLEEVLKYHDYNYLHLNNGSRHKTLYTVYKEIVNPNREYVSFEDIFLHELNTLKTIFKSSLK